MDSDDPALWPIDRVVFELCHNQQPKWADHDLRLLSNSVPLEDVFRNNDISGDVLLELDENDIKDELGITSFGQRRRLINIIDQLRDISPHYVKQQEKKLFRKMSRLSGRLSTTESRSSATPYQPSIETDRYKPEGFHHSSHDFRPDRLRQSPMINSPSTGRLSSHSVGPTVPVTPLKSEGTLKLPDMLGDSIKAQQSRNIDTSTGTNFSLSGDTDLNISSKTSKVNRPNDMPVLASSQMDLDTISSLSSQPPAIKTGSNILTVKSVKRVIPTPMTSLEARSYSTVERMKTQNESSTHWIAKRENAEREFLSHTDDASRAFGWVAFHPSPTRPRAAARQMNRFLGGKYHTTLDSKSRTQPPRERRTGAKLPSRDRLRRGTLIKVLTLGANGYEVHKARDQQSIDRYVKVAESSHRLDQPAQLSEYESDGISQYQTLLDRYPEADDDVVLPLYGDSDDDDRYTTADSLSPEPLDRSDVPQQKNSLSAEQIDIVIDQALKEFKDDWTQRRLAITSARACRMWKTAFRSPVARGSLLQVVTRNRELAEARLPGLRRAIHTSTWTKAEDVRRQCESLQATVDQYEENRHFVQALESEQEPLRCHATTAARPRAPRPNLEDDEIECESDGASMGEFILADDGSLDSESDGSSLDVLSAPQEALRDHHSSPPTSTPNAPTRTQEALQLHHPHEGSVEPVSDSSHDVLQLSHGDDYNNDEMQDVKFELPRTPQHRRPSDGYSADADEDPSPIISLSTRRVPSSKKRETEDARRRNPLSMPIFTDSSEDELHGSVDKSTRPHHKGKWHSTGHTATMPIDLSILTSSPSHSTDDVHHADSLIRTPELNPTDPNYGSTQAPRPQPSPPSKAPFPGSLPDLVKVRSMRWENIARDPEDHFLGLAKAVTDLIDGHQSILAYVQSIHPHELEENIKRGLSFLKSDDETVIDIPRNKREVAMKVTWLFLHYACVDFVSEELLTEGDYDLAWSLTRAHSHTFQQLLIKLLCRQIELLRKGLITVRSTVDLGTDTGTETATDIDSDIQAFELDAEEAEDLPNRRHKSLRRVRSAKRDDAPLNSQRMAKQRVADQEARKAILIQKLALLPVGTSDVQVPVNFKEPIVFLNQHIARRIKPHQVSGLQFLWRELIEDEEHQGCLLAHTMGLGKTMQVISLLVTIKLCIQSSNPAIRAHVPEHMHDLRILILCPAPLAENWFDELLFWMPNHDTLGPIVKISSQQDRPYASISLWAETGGVLILSYNRLHLYTNPPTRRRHDSLDKMSEQNSQYQRMAKWLTDLPKIVVADEAHMLKNPASKMATSAMQLKTLSRIALTGSPLSNHIEEYWAMINFIAPNYLGSQAVFRQKFVTPINASLASNSQPYERRVGLKKMHVLRKLVGPKVNRADITAIKNDLPSKTEFFITVPLTGLQKRAYQIFIQHCREDADRDTGRGKTTKLFHWVSILTLLCNHPHAFVSKLRNKKDHEDSRRAQEAFNMLDDEGDADDAENNAAANPDITNQPAVIDGMQKATAVFEDFEASHGLEDPSLSYRALLVSMIVEETIKMREKILIFSHSLPSLDYLGILLDRLKCPFERVDGAMAAHKRQLASKNFNSGRGNVQAFIVSTRAGGLGLNLQGATRVVIFDYGFNPSWEEQAIGRAYRIGQKKPVFVYRFRAGGTFEDITFNSAVFKTQLFTRVIDHKAIQRRATKADADSYFFDPYDPIQCNFDESKGKDPHVLDKVMQRVACIRNIELTETFAQEILEDLTEQEIQEVNEDIEMENLQRKDPAAYQVRRNAMAIKRAAIVAPRPSEVPGFAAIRDALHGPPPYSFVRTPRPYGPGLSFAAPTLQAGVRADSDDTSRHNDGSTGTPSDFSNKEKGPNSMRSSLHGLDGANDVTVDNYEARRTLHGNSESEGAQGCNNQ